MDPQFEELAKHIADDVVKRIDGVVVERLGDAEKRLDDVIVKRLGEAEKRLTEQFTGAETRLTEKFTEAEKRLSDGAKMNMEELKGLVKLAAEGYGATLERIERDLKELNTDHGRRITALERRR